MRRVRQRGRGSQTVILIAPHSRTHDIAQQLAGRRHGEIRARCSSSTARLKGLASQLKAGEYAIPSTASMAAIAAILVSGKSIQHKLTVAEGLTSDMIWKLVEADPDLMGDAGPVPHEGTLLPETYLFTRGRPAPTCLPGWQTAQAKFLDQKWPARAAGLPFKTLREAMTLASIVEKETALAGRTAPYRLGLRQPAEDGHEAPIRPHHHLWHYQGLSAGPRHPPERD